MAYQIRRIGRFVAGTIATLRATPYNPLKATRQPLPNISDTESTTGDSSDDEYYESTSTSTYDEAHNVITFGSTEVKERFTFAGSQEYDIGEREIDQKQTKIEAQPSKIIKIKTSGKQSKSKKMKIDPFNQKRKLDDSSSDEDFEWGNSRNDTSDYFSNEGVAPTNDFLPRTKSAPNVSNNVPVTFNIGIVKDSSIETGHTFIDGSKQKTTNATAEPDLQTLVKERTQMILKSQTVEGVETEAYMKLKVKTKHMPKLAIMVGKGSDFFARKFLKDHLGEMSDNKRCPDVYVLENPNEWSVVRKDEECVVAILGDESFDESTVWMKKIKYEILPTLRERENIKVVITSNNVPTCPTKRSMFEKDDKLHEFVIDIANTQLGPKVRQRLIWHALDRYGISVCEKQGTHADHTRCISEKQIAYIANNTGNLCYAQRIDTFFSRYTETNIDHLDEAWSPFIEIIKQLDFRNKLALLAMEAFGSRLKGSDIESFRAKGFTLNKHFRHSTANIREKEIQAEVLNILTKLAKDQKLHRDMWDIIEIALRKMNGTVVRECNGSYYFDGKAMRCSFLLSGFIPLETIIRICDERFFYNLVIPHALATDEQTVIYVGASSTNLKKAVFVRLRDQIKEKEVAPAWNHILMAERWFCDEFLDFLKEDTGCLSKFILQTDRLEKYNALYFGMEQQFRIQIQDRPANLTELILHHKSYPKWQKRSDYCNTKDFQEVEALRHAIELERVSTVTALLNIGAYFDDKLLLLATDTRNYHLILNLVQTGKQKTTFKGRCLALKRSLELYSQNNEAENEKHIFKLLAGYGSVDYMSKTFEPLIIMATKKRNIGMLKLLTTYHFKDVIDEDETSGDHKEPNESIVYDVQPPRIDVNLVKGNGQTALTIAVKRKYHEIVEFLLQNGADQRRLTRSNMELPIMIAVNQDDCHSLKLLIEHDLHIVNVLNRNGRTPLHEAVVEERLACLEVLLYSKELQVDATDSQNETALHKAVAYGKDGIVDKLLRAGADLSKLDIDKNTPLDIAISMDNIYCAELLLKAAKVRKVEPDNKILYDALRANNQKLLSILFRCGYDINNENRIYGTPLMLAIESRNLDLMRFLLRHKADPDRRQQDKPPIHSVRRRIDIEILQILYEFGARTDSTDNSGNTVLHLAVSADRYELAEDIIRLDKDGSLVDKSNRRGEMPLHIACKRGNADCVRVLLQNGATRGVFNKSGFTPEMIVQEELRYDRGMRDEDFRKVLRVLMRKD